MMEDYIIEAIVQVGNHKRVIGICESQVMQPQSLTFWQAKRTLVALELILAELEREQDTSTGLQETSLSPFTQS